MQNKIALFLSLIILVLVSACRKDNIIKDHETITPPTTIINHINAAISGTVTDLDGNIITNAEITWGAANTKTDERGIFVLSGVVKEQNAVLKVEKGGFFAAIQTLQVFPNETIRTKIELIPRVKLASMPSVEGGLYETTDGGGVQFAADGFVDSQGNHYEGSVHIFAHYLDPTLPNLQAIMPGNLLAINTENTPQLLQSFGMLNVELEDDLGNPLQLSKAATITVPVPSTIQNQAPQTIPLWFFDTTDGLWKEEGSATLQNGVYTGEVNHFTWWNCDVPNDFVLLEGSIQARGIAPVFSARITIIEDGIYGITNISDKGQFSGMIPINKLLLLEILNSCEEVIYSEEIGPFTMDTKLPTIFLNDTGQVKWHILEGTLLGCDNNPVSFGYLIISSVDSYLQEYLVTDESGNFHGLLPDCGSTVISYYGVDPLQSLASETQNVLFNQDTDLGNITACFEDITGEMTIDNGGTIDILRPCIVNILPQNGNLIPNKIMMTHAQEEGIVFYELIVTTLINQPTNWVAIGFSDGETIVQGNPEKAYDFDFNAPIDVIVLENNGIPGTIFHFVANVTLKDRFSGDIINDDVDIDIKAIFQ